jgi:uncharacterized protein (DUF1778 family)
MTRDRHLDVVPAVHPVMVSAEQYDVFLRLLDEPLESTEKLEKLWSRTSPFGRRFTPRDAAQRRP